MYYLLVIIAVCMFGGCFALSDAYRTRRGSSVAASLESSFVGAVAGLLVLFFISGFTFEITPFTLLMALLAAVNGIGFMFFSFKALEHANLSLYSLFSMLGGMMLPFLQGIFFYGEAITLAKIACVVLVCAALSLTVSRDNRRGGTVYYAGVFLLNGLSGVLSKFFTSAPYPKTSAEWFSIWIAVFTAVVSGVLWLLFQKQRPATRYSFKDLGIGAANGIVNRVANFILVAALLHLDASVQYPLVTGGVIIVSTLICFFGKNKPTKKELISVAVAFLAMLSLFLIRM